MRVFSAVLFLGQSKLEATVEDRTGARRRVTFSWQQKEPSDVPPAHWLEAVWGEVEYQLSIEHNPPVPF